MCIKKGALIGRWEGAKSEKTVPEVQLIIKPIESDRLGSVSVVDEKKRRLNVFRLLFFLLLFLANEGRGR